MLARGIAVRYSTLIRPSVRPSCRGPAWSMVMPGALLASLDGVAVEDGHGGPTIGTVVDWRDASTELAVGLDLDPCRRADELAAGGRLALSVAVWGEASEKHVADKILGAWADRHRQWVEAGGSDNDMPELDLGDYEHQYVGDYLEAMAEQAAAEAEVTRWSDRRALAVYNLSTQAGWSYARIGEVLGLSRARAQQLVVRGRDVTL